MSMTIRIKKVLSLLIGFMLLWSCSGEAPTPNAPLFEINIPSELDSITHINGSTTWSTYFSFDDQGRVILITGTGHYANWRKAFEYEGDRLLQINSVDIWGNQLRDSLIYNSQDRIVQVYHYKKSIDRPEVLSSYEERNYNNLGYLSESLWSFPGATRPLYDKRSFEWKNGNLIKEEYYLGQELLFDQLFVYDDKPSAKPFTHFGLRVPNDLPTTNNIINESYNSHGAEVDGLCTPCEQQVNYDNTGRPVTTETNYGYFATYHYE